jgi:diacylglycerol kinase (ATP)
VKPKIIFIINPTAGQGSGQKVLPELAKNIQNLPGECDIVGTQYAGHAVELAHEAATNGYDIVVAVGGDGTSNEVLNGIMQAWTQGYRDIRMGIVGIGRGNDFAYAFGIPPGLQEGLGVLVSGKSLAIDVGHIVGGDYPQGRYFGNGVGIGFDAVVGFEAMKLTHLHGFLNYVVAALRTIFLFFDAPLVRLDYDGQVLEQPSLMVSIMNGTRMGGGFQMAPEAKTDDGILEICLAGQMSRPGILMMIPRFMKGTQASQPEIKMLRAVKIHVTALQGRLPAHADGETICTAGKDLTIEVIKQPLKIMSKSGMS